MIVEVSILFILLYMVIWFVALTNVSKNEIIDCIIFGGCIWIMVVLVCGALMTLEC